jgi:hypothetical protein
MNRIAFQSAAITLASLIALQTVAEETTRLSVGRSNAGLELSWPATIQKTDGSVVRPYFELQRTFDFQRWEPIGERQRAATATLGQSLSATQPLGSSKAFYRLLSVQPSGTNRLGTGGAEVFGYGDAFAAALQRIGQISPDQFSEMFPSPTNYLPGISWDVTTGQFWGLFNADPDVVNSNKNWGDPGYRYQDYRLNAPELARFRTNGFVVSERLRSYSFAEAFYNL